jgi:hypothetical protein
VDERLAYCECAQRETEKRFTITEFEREEQWTLANGGQLSPEMTSITEMCAPARNPVQS